MANAMATERIAGEQDDVHQHNQRSQADPEAAVPIERLDGIDPEKDQCDGREVHEVAVQVLHGPGKRGLSAVALARLADGAPRRVGKKGAVIRLAIIVAGPTEPQDYRERYDRHREEVARDFEELGRIERREIRARLEVPVLPGGPESV